MRALPWNDVGRWGFLFQSLCVNLGRDLLSTLGDLQTSKKNMSWANLSSSFGRDAFTSWRVILFWMQKNSSKVLVLRSAGQSSLLSWNTFYECLWKLAGSSDTHTIRKSSTRVTVKNLRLFSRWHNHTLTAAQFSWFSKHFWIQQCLAKIYIFNIVSTCIVLGV